MTRTYTHLELGKEIPSPSGYYTLDRELRLRHRNRPLLIVIGSSVVDSSCCGAASWDYAIVPGYVNAWHSGRNKNGLPLSQIEPVTDEGDRREIDGLVRSLENVATIEFW